jgi:hypothetical protein
MKTEEVDKVVCKFDPHCKRYGCHFLHPSRSGKSHHKVLIVNNDQQEAQTNTRQFALPESTVEKVQTMEVDA